MKNPIIILVALVFILTLSSFILINKYNINLKTSQEKKKPKSLNQIYETNNIHVDYTIRSLINSSTASEMSVTVSGGGVTITTSNGTPTVSDKYFMVLSTDFSFGSDNIVTVNSTYKTWIVPFDGTQTPVQIVDEGGGNKCYKHFCPCKEHQGGCTNECQPGQPIQVGGRWCATCVANPEITCSQGCGIEWCQVTCGTVVVTSTAFIGPSYMIRANTLTYNGISY